MTSASQAREPHPVLRAVALLHAALDELGEAPLWSLSVEETTAAVAALTGVESRVAELRMQVVRHAEEAGLAADVGVTSTATWLAHQTRVTRRQAHSEARLAERLGRWARVRRALARGAINLEQARAIVRALDELPDDLGLEVSDRAETHLVELAGVHDPHELKVLGDRVLEVVAPGVADGREARLLEAEEREALAACRFGMVDDGYGKTYGRFVVPTATGAALRKMLLALAAPRRRAALDGALVERRPTAERLGLAFKELVERYPADRLPDAGGVNATVVVTVDLETLMSGTRAAGLDTGERISPGEARRLACEAGIIPAVLGGASQVLDLGRKRRFHTASQRVALGLRDGGCTAVGCDVPPGLCHAHHDVPWSRGGPTSVDRGRLLCPRHHRWAHDPAFQMAVDPPTRRVAFHRRT